MYEVYKSPGSTMYLIVGEFCRSLLFSFCVFSTENILHVVQNEKLYEFLIKGMLQKYMLVRFCFKKYKQECIRLRNMFKK